MGEQGAWREEAGTSGDNENGREMRGGRHRQKTEKRGSTDEKKVGQCRAGGRLPSQHCLLLRLLFQPLLPPPPPAAMQPLVLGDPLKLIQLLSLSTEAAPPPNPPSPSVLKALPSRQALGSFSLTHSPARYHKEIKRSHVGQQRMRRRWGFPAKHQRPVGLARRESPLSIPQGFSVRLPTLMWLRLLWHPPTL